MKNTTPQTPRRVGQIASLTPALPSVLPGSPAQPAPNVSTMPTARTRAIVLVDDHPMMREGMKLLINSTPDLRVVGEAGTAAEAIGLVPELSPDLVVLDLTLPDRHGLEVLKELIGSNPRLAVLVVSMHDEMLYAERALRSGARGYLMKESGGERLLAAIRSIMSGKVYVSDRVSTELLSSLGHSKRQNEPKSPMEALTDREFQIFRLIGQGKNTKRIAEEIGISPKTVDVHRANMKEKLAVPDMPSLIRHAVCWLETQDPGLKTLRKSAD